MSLFYFEILYREDFDKCHPPDSMVGHLFQNYDTIHTWGFLFHSYLRSFLFYGFSLLMCLFQANVPLKKHAYLCVTKKYVLVAVQDGGIELYRQQL